MAKLLEINRLAIFAKLDKVRKKEIKATVYYLCNDVIDAISDAKPRDKRIINEYSDDEVTTFNCNIDGMIRVCRFFSYKGICRYVHTGHVYSYVNVCKYFKLEPIDKKDLAMKKEVEMCKEDGVYITKKILQWICDKRKSDKTLGDKVDKAALLEWIKLNSDSVNQDKVKYIS